MDVGFVNPEYERKIKELEQEVANLEALRGAGLEEIKQVLERRTAEAVNTELKKGWVLLDVKVIQLSPESERGGTGYYILGRKNAI